MKRLLILFVLLLSLSCLAQRSMWWEAIQPTSTGYTPTNLPTGESTNLVSWWYAADTWTNGAVLTLPDRSGKNNYDLTNGMAASFWPTRSASNTLVFGGATDFLRNCTYTSSQPHEVVMCFKYRTLPTSVSAVALNNGTNSSTEQTIYFPGGVGHRIYAGGAVLYGSTTSLSNVWFVVDALFNGGSSIVLTNNVTALSGNAGTITANGRSLGTYLAADPSNGNADIEFAEMVTFSAALSSTARTDLYNYFKTLSPITKQLALP